MLKDILEEIKNSDYKELEYNDWNIYSSNHSLQRNLQRFNLSYNIFDKILREIIIFFDSCDKCLSSEYLVYSKKYEQGFIINLYKKDKKIKIITILPPKKQLLSDNKTQKIYLENINIDFYDKNLTEYAILNKDYFYVDINNNHIDIDMPIIILEDNKIF